MSFAMNDVGRPVTDQDIGVLERRLGVTLPKDYRLFLKQYNGGIPTPAGFSIHGLGNNPKGIIQEFMGIDQHIVSSNLDWTAQTFAGRIPKNLFPIARDEGGSLVCVSLFGADQGTVYYWYLRQEHAPPSYQNVYLIADSFEEFLDGLHHYDPLRD